MRGRQVHSTKVIGIMTWTWLVVGAIFAMFSFLSNLNNNTQFEAAQVFTDIYLFSFVLLLALPMFDRFKNKLTGDDGEKHFWLQDITFHKLIYVFLGFLLVVGAAYFAILIGQPLVGIFISGFIMLFMFYRTNSILIPIFIHGAYNSFVVIAQSGLIGASIIPLNVTTSELGVPIIGISISASTALLSEILYQCVLVAPAEELLKMLLIAFVVVNVKGGFTDKGLAKWYAGFIAVIVWGSMHLLNAI